MPTWTARWTRTPAVRVLLAKSGMNAVTVMADDGSTGTISPDARETLLISTTVPFPLDPQQLEVASVSVAVNSALAQSDGDGFSVEDNTGRRNDGDGAGSLLVSTSGDFREGDMLFWDANGNAKYDAGMEVDTVMDMSNGMASADFGLDEVTLPGRSSTFPTGTIRCAPAALRRPSASSTACRRTRFRVRRWRVPT